MTATLPPQAPPPEAPPQPPPTGPPPKKGWSRGAKIAVAITTGVVIIAGGTGVGLAVSGNGGTIVPAEAPSTEQPATPSPNVPSPNVPSPNVPSPNVPSPKDEETIAFQDVIQNGSEAVAFKEAFNTLDSDVGAEADPSTIYDDAEAVNNTAQDVLDALDTASPSGEWGQVKSELVAALKQIQKGARELMFAITMQDQASARQAARDLVDGSDAYNAALRHYDSVNESASTASYEPAVNNRTGYVMTVPARHGMAKVWLSARWMSIP